MAKKRQYKLYMDFGTNISSVITNPIGQFQFIKNGTVISTSEAANYFFITGDQRYFKLDRSTMGIRSMGAYLSSTKNYDASAYNEFTLSFFVRIPRYVLNECTDINFPLDGIKWDDGEIILYEEAPPDKKSEYKGRYMHLACCGTTLDVIYNYQAYDGDSYMHFAITLIDGILRIFINGMMCKEAHVTPNCHFNNMKVGNFTIKDDPKLDTSRIPVLVFDELAICDRCLWTESFIVPNRPLMAVFPEIVDEEPINIIPTLEDKINSAPNFYSRNKTYFDADLDRADIVRMDKYKPSMYWKANMKNKHKFNQDEYDFTAKSNWEFMYRTGGWPTGRPKT